MRTDKATCLGCGETNLGWCGLTKLLVLVAVKPTWGGADWQSYLSWLRWNQLGVVRTDKATCLGCGETNLGWCGLTKLLVLVAVKPTWGGADWQSYLSWLRWNQLGVVRTDKATCLGCGETNLGWCGLTKLLVLVAVKPTWGGADWQSYLSWLRWNQLGVVRTDKATCLGCGETNLGWCGLTKLLVLVAVKPTWGGADWQSYLSWLRWNQLGVVRTDKATCLGCGETNLGWCGLTKLLVLVAVKPTWGGADWQSYLSWLRWNQLGVVRTDKATCLGCGETNLGWCGLTKLLVLVAVKPTWGGADWQSYLSWLRWNQLGVVRTDKATCLGCGETNLGWCGLTKLLVLVAVKPTWGGADWQSYLSWLRWNQEG